MTWPIEIQVSIIGAVLAAIGYVGKSLVDWWQDKRRERTGILAQLLELKALLDTSGKVFAIQQKQVKRLEALLQQNHPNEYKQGEGYDERMARCYPVLLKGEKELHGIIRAYTEYSMRRINEAMAAWIDRDKYFKTGQVKSNRREKLAERLRDLEMHLLLWQAKYQFWIPDHPEHALVYMEDEKGHGLGFPKDRLEMVGDSTTKVDGVETEVGRVLIELRQRWQ